MKARFLLLVTLIIAAAAFGYGQSKVITKVGFTSATRGFKKEVFISNDSVTVILDGRAGNGVVKRKLASSEWDDLVKSLDDVDLSQIPQLKSPTSRRAFDGARHSTLTITNGTGAVTHSFDDEDPHPKLKPLMDCIVKISDSLSSH
jgi:hypothetical protein